MDVDVIAIDPGSPDATSTMLQAAATKPDAIVLNVPKGIMVPMLAAAEQQGLAKKIRFGSSTPAYNSDVPKAIGAAWNNNFDIHLEFMPVESAGAGQPELEGDDGCLRRARPTRAIRSRSRATWRRASPPRRC